MKVVKWISIIVGALVTLMAVLVVVAIFVVPMFISVEKYKPVIEEKVAEATGRSFTIGDDIDLSIFPWIGVSFSDLTLGNPKGFQEESFVSIKAFEVRVKLLPLILKDIQVKRLVVDEPRITLVKNKNKQGNWEGLGKSSDNGKTPMPKSDQKTPKESSSSGLPITGLSVDEFSITNGLVTIIDKSTNERNQIADINLQLDKISLDNPIKLSLSALLNKKPIALKGTVGPVGDDPGNGDTPLNMSLEVFDHLKVALEGVVTDPITKQGFNLTIAIAPFSPRKFVEEMGMVFPVETTDPDAIQNFALNTKIKGTPMDVAITDGKLILDQSTLLFSATVKNLTARKIAFDLNLDTIDLDRYLPPASEEKASKEKETDVQRKKVDYTPLRKLDLKGKVLVGKLKAKGMDIENILVNILAKNGILKVDPLSLNINKGSILSKSVINVKTDIPVSDFSLNAKGIQVGPFIKKFLKKDILEGAVKADVAIRMKGDEPGMIKKTLNGKGDLLFTDGAIIGIDLAGMVRNTKASLGLAEKTTEKPKTDFSEFHAPFTIKNGEVNTTNTQLISPLLRVTTTGKAHLVKETLDFRVKPKIVMTLEGQGDTKDRGGITVPILVTGTFSAPKFKADLKGILKSKIPIGLGDSSKIKESLKLDKKKEELVPELEKKAKDILKKLKF